MTQTTALTHVSVDQWSLFANGLRLVSKRIHENAVAHGFWAASDNPLVKHMLMVTEIAELTEVERKNPNARSPHIPQITHRAEEMADLFIRLCDLAQAQDVDLAQAVMLKMAFNESRPYMHGKTV